MNQTVSLLTRWKKDETEFPVKLSFDGTNSMTCRIPKPILELLGEPEGIKFVIQGKRIVVTGS
ncbi:hypothetical protein C5F50_09385 [Nitrosopumilus ureiphilus]|uniref:AbrB/MazE/SpoVT family DNA-binding domain-containing protein n=1 Tax=Nitrosopumilus ureiphilus TaxID=1470067 RepID=A0A7D5M846_9ARCH|nr:hypothetical protein C5F50_09385 [Nitrosopumilus ureiphilus]